MYANGFLFCFFRENLYYLYYTPNIRSARLKEMDMSTVVPFHRNDSWYIEAMERLVIAVQELSHARDIDSVAAIVRRAARELTGADGATFVLKDGDKCFYADENAISPLWKGQRFPLQHCVSGWVMHHKEPAIIEDIYKDQRVPIDAYRPTFVKSMAMVPIRKDNPIGAIGNYWAKNRRPTRDEIEILQALADVTAVAIENANLDAQLKKKIEALENSNMALSRFAWISSHDLKAPLRAIDNISQWIVESIDNRQYQEAKEHVKIMQGRVQRMERLLKDILEYAQIEYILDPYKEGERVSGAQLLQDVIDLANVPQGFTIEVNPAFKKFSLPRMPLQQVFSNLVNNAISHNDKKTGGMVTVDGEEADNHYIFTVSDNGPGIAAEYHDKIFEMFQVLKSRDVHEGSGMGLALVKKILNVYGSDITVNSVVGRGSVFKFTWPKELKTE
jgi:signal transduction histidine kinase